MSTKAYPAHRILLLIAAVSTVSLGARAAYRESRDLTLSAADLDSLTVVAGPGNLDIRGVDGLDRIEAKAEIIVDRISESKGADYVAKTVVFDLTERGGGARLVADHRTGAVRRDWSTRINVIVRMPAGMALTADDDSGDLQIEHLKRGLHLRDDSGDATVRDIAGAVTINDDSGSLIVEAIGGALEIDDDSGELIVRSIRGAVRIGDDSGDITVEDVTGDVRIDDDSGDIRVTDIQGNVTIRDDSGDITVHDISGDLDIPDAGSGRLHMNDIGGKVRVDS